MAEFAIDGDTLDIPRNIALLDTNVLVAYFNTEDSLHHDTRAYFELYDDFVMGVTPPVVVETCGMLMSRTRAWNVQQMLEWLMTPGTAFVFPSHFRPMLVSDILHENSNWMRDRELDYVDSYLMHTAHSITTKCEIQPSVPIITFDMGDFMKCSKQRYRFSLLDPRSADDLLKFD